MLNHRSVRNLLWMVPLLLTILACSAATYLILLHLNLTHHLTSSAPSNTTALSDAACTARLPSLLTAANSDDTSGSTTPALDPEVTYLVVYDVHGNQLGIRDNLIVADHPQKEIDSHTAHERIWDTFTTLIPPEDRTFVSEFSILTDGRNNILAGVSPTFRDPSQWTLKVDVLDAENSYSLIYSLLHEYGHLLTLNASQVPPDDQVFYHPHDQAIKDQAVASCPEYFTGEGCSTSSSYINKFYGQFWSSFYAEWQKASNNQDVQRDLLDEFYRKHEEQFLTSYAATSPQEDIAESWTYFILSPKPEPDTVANQKILFFYQYPELVTLRQEILKRLCASFPTQ